MTKNKWFIKTIRAILVGGISSFVYCPQCFTNPQEENLRVLIYYIIAFFITFEIISLGVKIINKKYNWIQKPAKIIIANAILLFFVFIPINYIGVYLNFGYFERFSAYDIYFLNLVNVFTAVIILLYENSNYFLSSWEKSVVQVQEVSKQQAEYELQALKNQINPHFLFNNLNTLSFLVSEKNPQAEDYLLQLSNIYRYLLEERKSHLVAIEKEFEMIDSFIYLLKIKYEDTVQFIYDVNDFKNFDIATFTLQLLVENAVKHNVINDENHLRIHFYKEDNYLVVKNNILSKKQHIYTSGIGLENIKTRYEILSKNPVIIIESKNEFIVKIPIILK